MRLCLIVLDCAWLCLIVLDCAQLCTIRHNCAQLCNLVPAVFIINWFLPSCAHILRYYRRHLAAILGSIETYLNDSNTNANSTQSSHVSFNDFFELGQASVGMNDFGHLISSHGKDSFSATFDIRQTAGIWNRLGLGGESRVFPIQVFLSTTAFQL